MDLNFDIDVRAEYAASKKSPGASLRYRLFKNLLDVEELATDVDKCLLAPHREGRNRYPLQKLVWVPLHQLAVLEGARLAFVGVDHEIGWQDPFWDEAPFPPSRKGSSAAPREAGVRY